MSPDNLYLRFFSMGTAAAEWEARRTCREPGPDHAVLLAVLDGEVAGCGSYKLLGRVRCLRRLPWRCRWHAQPRRRQVTAGAPGLAGPRPGGARLYRADAERERAHAAGGQARGRAGGRADWAAFPRWRGRRHGVQVAGQGGGAGGRVFEEDGGGVPSRRHHERPAPRASGSRRGGGHRPAADYLHPSRPESGVAAAPRSPRAASFDSATLLAGASVA